MATPQPLTTKQNPGNNRRDEPPSYNGWTHQPEDHAHWSGHGVSAENTLKALKVDRLNNVLVHDADADRFNSGDGNASVAIMEKAKKIEAVCERHNVPLRVAALHFAMAHPAVTAVILGAQKPEEVKQNVEATTFETAAPDRFSAGARG